MENQFLKIQLPLRLFKTSQNSYYDLKKLYTQSHEFDIIRFARNKIFKDIFINKISKSRHI